MASAVSPLARFCNLVVCSWCLHRKPACPRLSLAVFFPSTVHVVWTAYLLLSSQWLTALEPMGLQEHPVCTASLEQEKAICINEKAVILFIYRHFFLFAVNEVSEILDKLQKA